MLISSKKVGGGWDDNVVCCLLPPPHTYILTNLVTSSSPLSPYHSSGDVDGFSVLQALLGAGFRLLRLNRVRLLRAVEEMGGKMPYGELCQVLLRSCADWTAEERSVVKKILSAMGITVVDRR